MAQQLWILRHGEAEPHVRPDAERRLTERGEAQARAAGAALAALGVRFDAVFTSPKVRALDTARLACESLETEPVIHQPLADAFDGREAQELIAGFRPDARVLVVGHEPDLSQTVHDLTGGRMDFKKGGVAAVRMRRTGSELIVALRPRELALMAS